MLIAFKGKRVRDVRTSHDKTIARNMFRAIVVQFQDREKLTHGTCKVVGYVGERGQLLCILRRYVS